MRLIIDNTTADLLGDRQTSNKPEYLQGFSSTEIIRHTHKIIVLWRDCLFQVEDQVLNSLVNLKPGCSMKSYYYNVY